MILLRVNSTRLCATETAPSKSKKSMLERKHDFGNLLLTLFCYNVLIRCLRTVSQSGCFCPLFSSRKNTILKVVYYTDQHWKLDDSDLSCFICHWQWFCLHAHGNMHYDFEGNYHIIVCYYLPWLLCPLSHALREARISLKAILFNCYFHFTTLLYFSSSR